MAKSGWALLLGVSVSVLSCRASNTLEARLVSAEDRGTAIEKNLDEAERYLDALDPEPAVGPLHPARQGLAHPDVGYYPERQMLSQRLTEDVKRLAQVRKEREARDRAKVIAERQSD